MSTRPDQPLPIDIAHIWDHTRSALTRAFETASMTKKVRNLRDRPAASFAIDPPGFMAMADSIGRIIEGGEAHAVNRRLRQKYLTAEAVPSERHGGPWTT